MNKSEYLKKQWTVLIVGFFATYGLSMMLWALAGSGQLGIVLSLIALLPGHHLTFKQICKNRDECPNFDQLFPAR